MEKVLEILIHIPKKLLYYLKEVFKQPGIKRYTLFTLVMTLFFVMATFPYESVIYGQIKQLEGKALRSITLADYSFSILGKVTVGSLSLVDKKNTSIEISGLNATVKPLKALLSRVIVSNLNIKKLDYDNGKIKLSGSITASSDLALDKKTNSPKDGTVHLSLKQLIVSGIKIQDFAIPDVSFSSIKGQFELTEGLIKITQLIFNGKDLKGSISGNIQLNDKKIALSKLNLNIDIKSDSGILENYAMLLESYINPASGTLQINLGGTLSKPKPKFIK